MVATRTPAVHLRRTTHESGPSTAFAHPVEREIARIFDEHGLEWTRWQLEALARAAAEGPGSSNGNTPEAPHA